MLVEALGQLLGAAAYDEAVRPPATTAVLEAQVAVAPADQPLLRRLLGALGVPQRAARDLGSLTLRRELAKGPDGSVRSRCFVNGSPTSGAPRLPAEGTPPWSTASAVGMGSLAPWSVSALNLRLPPPPLPLLPSALQCACCARWGSCWWM